MSASGGAGTRRAEDTGAVVESVLGPVPVAALGTTLTHEHLFVLTPDSQANWEWEGWDEEAHVAEAVRRLRELRDAGVSTVADPTVDGLGRNVARVRRVAEQVPGLNILVATGIYTYTEVPHYFAHRLAGPGRPDPMTELFVRDLREGVQGTGIRAAFLKCAIDRPGLTEGVERILRAVAGAHRETGAPVMVHTHPASRTGLEVARVLGGEGVAPERVLLAHSGDSTDADHLAALAERGFWLGMDRFGLETSVSFEDRVGVVVELCRRGLAGSMVLSQDASCHIDWLPPQAMAALPNWHYLHVLRNVVPALRERGVAQRDVDAMLVANPQRWLAGG
ncbi:phosphotriesterase [Streptomyces sp. NPDC059740]|uniref:phosphotriesterase family protein n=1 Tax=Streptomyces sp. NPDC059740 TaxID=3346926 RepID=UPI003664119A